MAQLNVSTPSRPDTWAIVDECSFISLNKWKWSVEKNGYISRKIRVSLNKQKRIWLSREVISAPAGLQVDHINLNPLDNRAENLRLCTQAENKRNKGMARKNKSGFKGVCWHPNMEKWQAKVRSGKRLIHLGYFDTAQDAGRAYDAGAIEHYGKFAKTNQDLGRFAGVTA